MKKIICSLIVFAFSNNLFAATDFLVRVHKDDHYRFLQRTNNIEPVTGDVYRISPEELEKLRSEIRWQHIEPNHKIIAYNLPNDLDSKQWGLVNSSSSGIDINIEKAWEKTTGSYDVVVAVTDTGIDVDHVDLRDNLWINKMEVNGQPGVDDDGNGYVDDFNGWNFGENNNNLQDSQRHGTHVAGIIGARGNNGVGIVGVNWEVSLMTVKFFPKNGEATVADAIKSIDYAINNGAHIINASWGAEEKDVTAEEFQFLSEAIDRAEQKNVLFVAAAGNSGVNNDVKTHIPAGLSHDNIITVGAQTRYGWPAGFSNYGIKTVDIFAPGSTIKSTLPGDYYGNLNGTSMAAPFVSGMLALVLAENPGMTYKKAKQHLLSNCAPNSNVRQKCVCGGDLDATNLF